MPTGDPSLTSPLPVDVPAGGGHRHGRPPVDGVPFALPILHPETIEPGELLLAWRSVADAARGEALLASRFGLRAHERLSLPALGWIALRYRLASNEQAAQVRQRLMQEHPAWLADFNTRYRAAGTPRHYAQRQVSSAIPKRDAGRNVRVGMLDGPVTALPALTQSLAKTRNMLADGETAAASDHGTAVAALIAGWDEANGFAGIAPGARVHAGVVMRSRAGFEDTTTRNLLAGLDWLAGERAEVINLSIGGPPNRLLAAAVFQLQTRRIALVSAAGNGGPTAEPAYPAAYPGVIAVTATDARNGIYAHANRGDYILLSAPGVDVWAPGPNGGTYASGTSFAAALVSGAAALALERRSAGTRDTLAARLCEDARDLGDPGRDAVFGCGLLRVPTPPPPP